MEIVNEKDEKVGDALPHRTRKSDGSDGPPLLRAVKKNVNTPGAPNSALSQPAPKEGEGVDPNHHARGVTRIVDFDEAIIESYEPDGVTRRKKFAICGFASSSRAAIPFDDPTWAIHSLNQLGRHIPRADFTWDIHAEPFTELVPGTEGDGPGSYLGWMRECGIPVVLLKRDPTIPTSVAYPIDRLIEKFGVDYFTSTVAYELAFVIDEIDRAVEESLRLTRSTDAVCAFDANAEIRATYAEYTIGIFGIDLVVGDEYFAQKACAEFWVGIAISRGINVMIPPQSALCKQQYRYGSQKDPDVIIKPREVEKHKAMVTAERDDLLKKLYMMEGALQVLEAPADATPKDAAVIRAERDETMKRALMLEGALEADHYWGDLVELRLRGADVRI